MMRSRIPNWLSMPTQALFVILTWISLYSLQVSLPSPSVVYAFCVSPLSSSSSWLSPTDRRMQTTLSVFSNRSESSITPEQDEAAKLLEKVKKMRAEIAALEGKSVEDVEKEAREKKAAADQRRTEFEAAKKVDRLEQNKRKLTDGSYLEVPETADDQVYQAKLAVERAYRDGLTRQIVRFALVRENEALVNPDRNWPGGAKQMYREAAGPLARNLLSQVRAVPSSVIQGDATTTFEESKLGYAPNITSQDVWDFDGSAIITALSQAGAAADTQALVQPNTDKKYLKDIQTIDAAMKERLFLIVNPFWRNIDSWGFDILSPNAKKIAQQTIYDRNFQETYCLIQKTVRGIDCVALKAYPYDWQLYGYTNKPEYFTWNRPTAIRLGSTKSEPKSSEFLKFIDERKEFEFRIM